MSSVTALVVVVLCVAALIYSIVKIVSVIRSRRSVNRIKKDFMKTTNEEIEFIKKEMDFMKTTNEEIEFIKKEMGAD